MKKFFGFLIIFISMNCNAGNEIVKAMPGISSSCGEYMTSTPREKEVDAIWSQGFLTGYNAYAIYKNGKQLEIPQTDTITLFIKNHCQKNPLSAVTTANYALIAELGGEPVKFDYNK